MYFKKAICVFMLFCLLSSFLLSAAAEAQIKVCINNEPVPLDVSPVLQNDHTLIPLRTLFKNLGCDVYWMDEQKRIIVAKNDVKLLMQIGNENFYKFTGFDFAMFKQQTNIEKYIFATPPQILDGKTFVPIRAVCEAMDMDVRWDDETQTVSLSCEDTFIKNINTDQDFASKVFAYFRQSENTDVLSKDKPVYEDGNLDILIELNIILKEDLHKDTYISNIEALKVLHKIIGYNDIETENFFKLREWYMGTTLEPLDDLDDTCKNLLLDLFNHNIMTYDDALNMDFNENITNYEALVYITRMIGDTYDCTNSPAELDFTEKVQTYTAAFEKGIIHNMDMESADLPILRENFYEFIHKAIFVERNIGGYAPTKGRYADTLANKKENVPQPTKEVSVHTNPISVEAVIDDDMSISWVLPDEYKNLIDDDYMTTIETFTAAGVIKNRSISATLRTCINTTEIIKYITTDYSEKPVGIRCTYSTIKKDAAANEEYTFDIDISAITMRIEGNEITPGVYTHFQNQWVPESISLANGQSFKKDAYYLLKSYEHTYRKPEYNTVSRVVFRAYEDSNILYDLSKTDNGIPRFISGGVYLDDIHIQEIIMKGSADSGFVLYVTPESQEIFKVKEGSARTA